MSGTGPSVRASPVLLVVVLVALAIGAAASLLAGAAASPSYHSGPDSELIIPIWGLESAFLVAFAVVVGVVIWVRLSTVSSTPGRVAVMALVVLLVGILFVVVLQSVGGSGGFPTGGGNSTGAGGSSNLTNPGTNGSLSGPGGVLAPLHVPAWSLFVVVAAVALLVAGLAAPRLWGLWTGRDRDGPSSRAPAAAEVEALRSALSSAAQALDVGTEPRDAIVALYATVLARVDPLVGGVDSDTPEEIRALHLVRLGIGASEAETLTRLFEEARYSTHPMGVEAADRARTAITRALADLAREPSPP
jgi:hypothetical protein